MPRSARATRSTRRSTRGARSSSRKPTRCARCCATSSTLARELRRDMKAAEGKGAQPALREEIVVQLGELVGPRTLSSTPPEWRKHLPRYLRAARARWDKRGQRQDADLAAQIRAAEAPLERWRAEWPDGWPWPDGSRRLSLADRGAACLAVRAAARHRAARIRETARAGLATRARCRLGPRAARWRALECHATPRAQRGALDEDRTLELAA